MLKVNNKDTRKLKLFVVCIVEFEKVIIGWVKYQVTWKTRGYRNCGHH